MQPRNRIQNYPNSIKNLPKAYEKSFKIVQKSIQNRLEPTSLSRRFLDRSWFRFGSNLEPSWVHVGAMLINKNVFWSSWGHAKTTMISNTIRDPLGTDFKTILTAKIDPKSIQERSQERSWSKCKNIPKSSAGPCFWGFEKDGNRSKMYKTSS